jgi:hypothetical protein
MAFAIIFGFTSGSYFVLVAPIFTTILPINQFYSGLTLAFLTNVIPVFGTNIASAIQEGTNTTPFFTYKMFTGVAYLLGAIVLLYLKLKVNKNIFARI